MVKAKKIFDGRPHLKKAAIILCSLAVVIASLQIWFVGNAKGVLQRMVFKKSDGKLKLELSDVNFDFFSNKLQIREGHLISTDSLESAVTYRVKFRKLTLKVRSFWPLLFNKKLYLDSIKLHDPEIEILRWRQDTVTKGEVELSIAREMGKVYRSMIDMLKEFEIKRIITNNASVSLVNKMKPSVPPITLSKIYLNVVRSTADGKTFSKDESVDLTTSDQEISFPSGRHNLSFKSFKLQLFRKRIQLDSCTFTSRAKGNGNNNFKIFFKKLMLVGVDFDAMYEKNLIRADSVYCEDPLFDIGIERGSVAEKKKANPDPEKIVRELTGDFDLAYVGVKNAGIQIKFSGAKTRSMFNSHKDNFEMHGLRVSPDSSVPVTVRRFDMLMRGYKLYNEDSSVSYTFDSVHFINKKIILSNFRALTASNENKARDLRDFTIPRFEVTGLDWYQLIFNQTIKAEEAILHDPIINFTKTTPKQSRKKLNLYAFLQNLDSLMTLNKLDVINGTVNLKVGLTSSINVSNANVSLYSNRLLEANTKNDLRKSLENFSFSNATINLKNFTAQLQGVKYTGDNLLHANKLAIGSKTDKIKSEINDVYIDNLLLDEETETISADGLRWKDAVVVLKPQPSVKGKSVNATFDAKNIAGDETQFIFSNGNTNINTSVTSLKVAAVGKTGDGTLQADGVSFGETFVEFTNLSSKVKASINNLSLNSISFDNDNGLITDGLTWNNAVLDGEASPSGKSRKPGNDLYTFKNVSLNDTKLKFASPGSTLSSFLDVLKFSSFAKTGIEPAIVDGYHLTGRKLLADNAFSHLKVDDYQFSQTLPSYFSQVSIEDLKQNDSLSINTPRIDFSSDLNELLNKKFHFKDVAVQAPVINLNKWNSAKKENSDIDSSTKSISIDKITAKEPAINIAIHSKDSVSTIHIPSSANSEIKATGFSMADNEISLGSLLLNTTAATYTKPSGEIAGVTNGKVAIDVSDLKFAQKAGKPFWSAMLNNADLENPVGIAVGKKKNRLLVDQLSVSNVSLSSENSINNKPVYRFTPSSLMQLKNGEYIDSNYSWQWFNSVYNYGSKTLSLDSVRYAKPRLKVLDTSVYMPDFLKFNTGLVTLTGFDPEKADSAFTATSMSMNNPVITLYNNNNHTPSKLPRRNKSLPVALIKKIASPVDVEQVNINNGKVLYTEKDSLNGKEGEFFLSRMNGSLYNIKNKQLGTTDSLSLHLTAYLMDTTLVNIKINESYTDSLHPFTFNVDMGNTSMKILNPVLAPLSNVMIKSGNADSLHLQVVATDSGAVGNITMRYHNLRIKLLKNGDPNTSSLKNAIISFFANSFVIKRNSKNRTNAVVVRRLPYRSFFNYIIKIAVTGLSRSVGVKK